MTAVSIVIRAYNEAESLRVLCEHLRQQDFAGEVQLVVVDNGSSDETGSVAREYGAEVVELPQEQFSYPKSLNAGIRACKHPIVVCLVAHAYPDDPRWLSAGVRHFRDPVVAGVFSYTKPHVGATKWDQLWWPAFWLSRLLGVRRVKWAGPGVMGATNAAVRRSVWEQHYFNEAYGAGGEDGEWAGWVLRHGNAIVCDPAFAVRHSHYLRNFHQAWQQVRLWLSFGRPRKFDRSELEFRRRR